MWVSLNVSHYLTMESTESLTNSSNNAGPSPPPKRVRLDKYDANEKESRSMFLERWKEQERYIDHLESRLNQLQKSIESDERLKEKDAECKKLRSMLNYRFLTKSTQQQTLEQMRHMMQAPSVTRLRQTYLDPSINLIFGHMREEIEQTRLARDEAQNELQACQFTSDSKTGKMLMARCKKLLEENQQLGKLVSTDNVAKLEGEIALQNTLLSNIKDTEKDYEDILLDMDKNMDAMSGLLLHLRQELATSNRLINSLNEENTRLKTLIPPNATNGTSS